MSSFPACEAYFLEGDTPLWGVAIDEDHGVSGLFGLNFRGPSGTAGVCRDCASLPPQRARAAEAAPDQLKNNLTCIRALARGLANELVGLWQQDEGTSS